MNPTTNSTDSTKDPNVVSFMMQLVQEKYGGDVNSDFLQQESDRLYDIFGNNLVGYFEPMLTDDQKRNFDQLVEAGNDQDGLLQYLTQVIPDLEKQILQILINFRIEYLNSPKQF